MVKSYEDLLAWQEAVQLANIVYRATKGFPPEERYGLTNQMRRAAVSVPSNIAEGQARATRGEFLNFLGIARGSLAELDTQTILARQLGMLPEKQTEEVRQQIVKVGKLLNGLRRSLATSHQPLTTSH
jgi:four helix bundle protein